MKKILFALLACAALLTACEPKDILVSKITLHKYEGSMIEGESRLIKAIVSPEAATNPEITWTSSNTAVATVEPGQTKNGVAQGTITAVSMGTATITLAATDGSGVTAEYELTVTEKSILVTRIQLTKESAKLNVGETLQLEAVVTPDNATYPDVQWASSNSGVATVDATGKVTAVKAGTAEITASATDGSNVKCDKACVITVREPRVQPMFVKFSNMKIRVGQSYSQSVWYGTVDEYGDREDVDLDVLTNCKSSNESVATIIVGKYKDSAGNDQEGVLITGVAPGTAVITIADQDGNSVQIPIEVMPADNPDRDCNYGIELFNARSLDNWITHGDLSLDAGYVEGTQCVWNKNFHREDAETGAVKAAYTIFAYKLPSGGVDIRNIQNPAIYLRFYVNDPSILSLDGSNAQIEITSSRNMDEEEVTFVGGNMFTNWPGGSPDAKMELKSGWNNIVLPLDYAQANTGLRLKTINYFRFYNNPGDNTPGNPKDLTGKGLQVAIDQIRVVDWTEFDTCDDFDRWFDGGTGNNRPCFRAAENLDGHEKVFGSINELITGPISNFRVKEWPGRVYSLPVNMDSQNAVFSWWFWVDDADWFNKCDIKAELSSENINDAHNWAWSKVPGAMNLKNGWNQITYDFKDALDQSGEGTKRSDRKINYFRIVVTPQSGAGPSIHTYYIDDLRISKK